MVQGPEMTKGQQAQDQLGLERELHLLKTYAHRWIWHQVPFIRKLRMESMAVSLKNGNIYEDGKRNIIFRVKNFCLLWTLAWLTRGRPLPRSKNQRGAACSAEGRSREPFLFNMLLSKNSNRWCALVHNSWSSWTARSVEWIKRKWGTGHESRWRFYCRGWKVQLQKTFGSWRRQKRMMQLGSM